VRAINHDHQSLDEVIKNWHSHSSGKGGEKSWHAEQTISSFQNMQIRARHGH